MIQVAPIVNKMIDDFEGNKGGVQIQAFGAHLREFMKKHDMSNSAQVPSDLVITHQDNRHGGMLRPINVWDLMIKRL